jgi:hypothetical protein
MMKCNAMTIVLRLAVHFVKILSPFVTSYIYFSLADSIIKSILISFVYLMIISQFKSLT